MRKEYTASGKTVDEAIDTACALSGRSIEDLDIEILELGGRGLFGIGHKDAQVRVSFELPDTPEPQANAGENSSHGGFGEKKSKRERFEEKAEKKNSEKLEIKPIITASDDPELAERLSNIQNKKAGDVESRDERPAANRSRSNRGSNNRSNDRSNEQRTPRESHATPIIEGEMADQLIASCRKFLDPIFVNLGCSPSLTTDLREGTLWLSCSGENLGLLIGRRGETLNSLQYLLNLVINKQRNDHVRVVIDVEGYREGREETLIALAHKMAEKAVRTGRRIQLEPMNPNDRRVVHLALQNDRRVETASHGEEPYRQVVISKRKNRNSRPRRRSSGNKRVNTPPAENLNTNAE